MLSYGPGVMRYFSFEVAWLGLLTILVLQNLAFRRSVGVIFLTRYLGKVIQDSCGLISSVSYILCGVDLYFKQIKLFNQWPEAENYPILRLHASNTEMYSNVLMFAIRWQILGH